MQVGIFEFCVLKQNELLFIKAMLHDEINFLQLATQFCS
jgi:hypothetical protein